jgi:ribonuclease P protein component
MTDTRRTLRATDRLKRREDFRRTQDGGRKHHSRHFLVVVHDRGDDAPARIGITVTKKVGNAVERNRVKRLVREVFRNERARFPVGCDVVFIARDGAPTLGYEQVLAEVPTRWSLRSRASDGRASDGRASDGRASDGRASDGRVPSSDGRAPKERS